LFRRVPERASEPGADACIARILPALFAVEKFGYECSGDGVMILAALVATSLIIPAAVDRSALSAPVDRGAMLSLQQKRAAVAPLVTSATECIARIVSADPRFPQIVNALEVNELIVESVPSCVGPVRSMIDAYDRLFGDGAGESFFMGPYLDALPAAVDHLVGGRR
jgi:hypothetical protein